MNKLLRFFVFLIALFSVVFQVNAQTIRYVKEGGAGTKDGSSWLNAADDLQAIIQASAANDVVAVAKGTYLPIRKASALTVITPSNRENAFVLKANVKIYGGFVGAEVFTAAAANLSELLANRNLVTDVSTLSGDFNGNDVVTGSGASLAITGNAENSYHVVYSSGNVGNAVLDGFTITGGNANNTQNTVDSFGGGVFTSGSNPKLSNLVIHGNNSSYGGGFCTAGSSAPVLTNATISSNISGFGGGVASPSSGNITLNNVIIVGNKSTGSGGGIASSNESVWKLTNVLIIYNSGEDFGGGISSSNYSSFTLTNTTFFGNSLRSRYPSGLAIGATNSSEVVLRNCIVFGTILFGNSATVGYSNCFVESSVSTANGNVNANGIDASAIFVNPSLSGNFQLKAGSAVINAGNSSLNSLTTDLAGNKRISRDVIDLGAYEYQDPTNALNFDGDGDVVTVPASNWLDQSELTLEAWFKPERQLGSNQTIFASRSSAATRFSILHATDKIVLWNGSSTGTVQLPKAFDLNRWYHLAVVLKANAADVYINGSFKGTMNIGVGSATNLPFQIGAALPDGSYETFKGSIDEVRIWKGQRSAAEIAANFNGLIANSLNYNNLLAYFQFDEGVADADNSAITKLVNSSSNSVTANLVNLLRTGTSSNWVESYAMVMPSSVATLGIIEDRFTLRSALSNIGTTEKHVVEIAKDQLFMQPLANSPIVLNNPTSSTMINGLTPETTYFIRTRAEKTTVTGQGAWTETKSITTSTTFTPPGNALNFDGANDYVNLGTSATLKPASQLSIGIWVNRADWNTPAFEAIISNTQGGGYSINIANAATSAAGKYITALVFRNGGYARPTFDASKLTPGWHYIAITYNGQVTTLYIDGKSVATDDAQSIWAIGYNATNGTLIGAEPDAGELPASADPRYFSGTLDELRIYDVALNAVEIKADMLSAASTKPANLMAHYKFDASSSSGVDVLYNMANHGSNGTLNNFALSGNTSNWVESYAMVVPEAKPATNVSLNTFSANWLAPVIGTADSYILDVATDANFASPVNGSPFTVNGLSKIFTGLNAGTSYYYRVRAEKASVTGQGAVSETVKVDTAPLTSLPGTALSFNGTNNYIKIGNANTLKPENQLSLGIWINRSNWDESVFQAIVSNTQVGGYSLNISNATITDAGKYITAQVRRGSEYVVSAFDASKLTPGWHYVTFTYNGSLAVLYVDGKEVNHVDKGSVVAISYNTNGTLIGAEPDLNTNPAVSSARYFKGSLDELRIYDVALTAEEVKTDMLSINSAKPAGLLAHYRFDDALPSTSTSLADGSGKDVHGDLIGFTFSGISNWVESYAMVAPQSKPATDVSDTKFTANWDAPTIGTLNDYVLDVATNADFSAGITGSPFRLNELSKEISGLTPVGTYYYRVRADKTSVTGTGVPSQTISVQTLQTIRADANNIVYVNLNVAGGNGYGSSWENATPQLADVLRWARQKNDFTATNPLKIYVAKGIYLPKYSPKDGDNLKDDPTDVRDKTFLMVDHVWLYGGFDPTNGINELTDNRIFGDAGTILSGDLDQNDTYDNLTRKVTNNSNANNAYHVVLAASNTANLTNNLDGFTIRGGNASTVSNIYVNGVIVTKSQGGGISNISYGLRMSNMAVYGNFAANGGGVYFNSLTYTVEIDIDNTNFFGNVSSSSGAGFYASGSLINANVNINGSKFYGHTTSAAGGAIYLNFNALTFNLNKTEINSNTSSSTGAGIYSYVRTSSTLNVTDVVMSNNNGGAIYFAYFTSSSINIKNSLIAKNTANFGAAIRGYNGSIANTGIAFSLNFYNSTITGNSGANEKVYLIGVGSKAFNVYNSLIFGNSGSLLSGSTIKDIKYSLVQGENNITNGNLNGSSTGYTTANIFADFGNGDYRLKENSPVIFKGSNALFAGLSATSLDLAGNSRVFGFNEGGTIDLGAYEYQGRLTTVLANMNDVSRTYSTTTFGFNDPVSNSTGVFSYSSSNEDVAVVTNNRIFTATGVGISTVTVTQSETGNHLSGSTSFELRIAKSGQYVSFPTISAKTTASADFNLVASVLSELPVTFRSSNTGVIEVYQSDGVWKAKVKNAGTANITAEQLGDENYTYANAVQSVSVTHAVLPVELLSYTVKAEANQAKLQWQTTNEQNNKGFVIYRSGDDKQFVKIGEVSPNHQPLTINYSYIDQQPLNGNNYYKLVQVDNDGTATELGIKSLAFNLQLLTFNVYPNPTKDKVTLQFTAGAYHVLKVSDLIGRVLQTSSLSTIASETSVNLGSYPVGVYLLLLEGKNGNKQVVKVVKQ